MKYVLIATLLFIAVVVGGMIGIKQYKQSCEVIGTSTTNKWRECSL